MFSCQQTQEIMSAYIDKQLTDFETEEFEKHISSCTSCKEEYTILYSIVKSCNSIEKVQLPKQYKEQLHQKLITTAKVQKRHNRQPWYLNWKTYSALAAGILLVVAMKSQIFVYDEYKRAYVDDASLNYIEDKDINKNKTTEEQAETYKDNEKEKTYDKVEKNVEKQTNMGKSKEIGKEQTNKEKKDSDAQQQYQVRLNTKAATVNQENTTSKLVDDVINNNDSLGNKESNLKTAKIATEEKNIKEENIKIDGEKGYNDTEKVTQEKIKAQNDDMATAGISSFDTNGNEESFSARGHNSVMMAMPRQLIINKVVVATSQENVELLWKYVGERLSDYTAESISLDNKTVIILDVENYFKLMEDFKESFSDLTIQHTEIDKTQQHSEFITEQNSLEEKIESLQKNTKITEKEKQQIQLLLEQRDKLAKEILKIEEMAGKYIIEIKFNE